MRETYLDCRALDSIMASSPSQKAAEMLLRYKMSDGISVGDRNKIMAASVSAMESVASKVSV